MHAAAPENCGQVKPRVEADSGVMLSVMSAVVATVAFKRHAQVAIAFLARACTASVAK